MDIMLYLRSGSGKYMLKVRERGAIMANNNIPSQMSGFFDSVDGDRLYNAAAFSAFYSMFFSDGVLTLPEDALLCEPAEDALAITVNPGNALVQGHYFLNPELTVMQLEAAHATYPRIDRVVLRYDNTTQGRSVSLAVITGTPASAPQAPALTRSDDVYELALCTVGIEAGGTSVASIQDNRQNDSLCGLVKCKFAVEGTPIPGTNIIPYGTITAIVPGSLDSPAGAYTET